MSDALLQTTKKVRMALGPLAGSAYFSASSTEGYVALGFDGSKGAYNGVGVSPCYHESRTALLGDVSPEVAVAVFPHFGPDHVRNAVARRRSTCSVDAIVEARQRGTVADLQSILGPPTASVERLGDLLRTAADAADTSGKPFAAAIAAQPYPGDPVGDLWHAAEILREHRGDAHVAAWVSRGLGGAEIQVLSSAWLGIGASYLHSWGWPPQELDDASAALHDRGVLDAGAMTPGGRELREEIEAATDAQCALWLRAVEDDVAEVVTLGKAVSAAVRAGGGFPTIGPDYFDSLARTIV